MSAQVAVFAPAQGTAGAGMVPVISMLSPDSAGTKSSKYKGVHWDKTKAKWVGYIHMKGKKHHLGYFPTEEDAARAYDRESLRCRGFTKNFPRTDYPSPDLATAPDKRKVLEKSSRFTGVSWNKLRRKWAARIIVDGRSQHMGHFAVEADAARAYDRMCFQSRGNTKNFPAEEYAEFFVNGVPKRPAGDVKAQQNQAVGGQVSAAAFASADAQQLAAGLQPTAFPTTGLHHQPLAQHIITQPGALQQQPNLVSHDSTDPSDPSKAGVALDGQPRLFVVQGGRGAAQQQVIDPNQATFNLYTTYQQPGLMQPAVQTHHPQPIAYQNPAGGQIAYQQSINPSWGAQPTTSQPQLIGYTGLPASFASLLPQSPATQADVPSAQGGPVVLQSGQSLQQSKPYTFVTPQGQQATMIPASLLPNLVQQPNAGLQTQPQAAIGMAQLQALMLQNTGIFAQQQQQGLQTSSPLDQKPEVGNIPDGQQAKRQRTGATGVDLHGV